MAFGDPSNPKSAPPTWGRGILDFAELEQLAAEIRPSWEIGLDAADSEPAVSDFVPSEGTFTANATNAGITPSILFGASELAALAAFGDSTAQPAAPAAAQQPPAAAAPVGESAAQPPSTAAPVALHPPLQSATAVPVIASSSTPSVKPMPSILVEEDVALPEKSKPSKGLMFGLAAALVGLLAIGGIFAHNAGSGPSTTVHTDHGAISGANTASTLPLSPRAQAAQPESQPERPPTVTQPESSRPREPESARVHLAARPRSSSSARAASSTMSTIRSVRNTAASAPNATNAATRTAAAASTPRPRGAGFVASDPYATPSNLRARNGATSRPRGAGFVTSSPY